MKFNRRTCLSSLVLIFSLEILSLHGQEIAPLYQRIDEAIAKAHLGNLANIASDNEFLRRVYINLVGRSPNVEELKLFIDSSDPNKRALAIDKLLGSEEFDKYFASVLDVMFMERRSGKRVTQSEWQSFLHKSMQQKWSFDQIVQAILTADGTGESRGAAKFLLERNVEPNALARDVGRIFLGRDLQCAQCHDHPTIVDYEQSEYYGIFAFVNRSYLFEEDTKEKKAFVGEKAEGDTQFSSVFSPDDSSHTAPRLLGELTLEAEPRFEGEQAYVIAPSKKGAGVPKFSRRAQLARLITHPANHNFSKNVVNRLWKHLLGYGLVDPVDFHHGDNLPSHPALLEMLAEEFVNSDFDFRQLLRQIALSKTYQLSVDFSAETLVADGEINRRIDELKTVITALEADTEQTSPQEISERLQSRRKKVAVVDQSITDTAKQLKKLQQQNEALAKTQAELQKNLKTQQSQLTLLQAAATAAKKVADSFPDDQAFAEKQTTYQQRAEQLAKDIKSTQTQLAEKTSLVEKNNQQIKVQQRQLAKLRGDRIGLADMLAEARGVFQEVISRQQQHKAQIAEKRQQLAALITHKEYLELLQTQQQLADRSTKLSAAMESLAGERDAFKQTIADIKTKLITQRDVIAGLTQESKAATTALTERQSALGSLKTAIENAQSAAGQLADPELDAAVKSLNEKHTVLNQQLTSDKQLATKKQEELTAAQALLKHQEAEQTEVDAKLNAIADRETECAAAIASQDTAMAETDAAHKLLHQSWERRFSVRALVPLTPEQLAGSTISALELKPRFLIEAQAEWQTKNKEKIPEQIDEAKKTAEIASLLQKRLDQVTATYVSMFAAPGGAPQDVFSATADQALFLANDGTVQAWFSAGEGSLLKRLESIENTAELADQLHLAILSRPATEEEKVEIEAFLAQQSDTRNAAVRELAWGLLTSLEFRFNH